MNNGQSTMPRVRPRAAPYRPLRIPAAPASLSAFYYIGGRPGSRTSARYCRRRATGRIASRESPPPYTAATGSCPRCCIVETVDVLSAVQVKMKSDGT